MVSVSQVVHQQRGRPHRGSITPLTRIGVTDRFNERVDNALGSAGATTPRSIRQTNFPSATFPFYESLNPVVYGSLAHPQLNGNLVSGLTFIEPEQGIGPSDQASIPRVRNKVLQLDPLAVTKC
jgi:hypothetical protein